MQLSIQASDVFQNILRERVADIASVESGGWLEKHHFNFFRRIRLMLDAARNHEELSRTDCNRAVTEAHLEGATMDEKQLIFGVVLVPDEFTFELNTLHELSI